MGGKGRNKRRAKRRQTERNRLLNALGMTPNQKIKSTQGSSSADAFGLTRDGKIKSTCSGK